MKATGLSVAAITFAILVIAIDSAVIRAAFLGPHNSLEPGRPLLPSMFGGNFLDPKQKVWAVFAYYLLPMIDALLIGVYRLRRRGGHTARTVGYIIAGSAATLAVLALCLFSTETVIGMVGPVSRRIALAIVYGLEPLFGKPWLLSRAMEWTYIILYANLFPIAFFCIPPLLVAVIGGRVARHFRPGQPTMGAGFGEMTQVVEEPDMVI